MSMSSQFPTNYLETTALGFTYPRVSLSVRSGSKPETMPPPPARPRRVLVVQDDRPARTHLEAALRSEGLETTGCALDDDVLAAAARADVVLLFPSADGAPLETCRRLQAFDTARTRAILVCGGRTDNEEAAVLAFDAGADDYVTDTTRVRELAARVKTQMKHLRDREVMLWARAQRSSLRDLAHTDSLTGIANRRAVTRAIEKALAAGDAIAVVLVDLDHFKAINDTYGHPAGDLALKRVARALDLATPTGGLSARWGGEEFAIVVRGELEGEPERLGERIRRAVSEVVLFELAQPPRITASIGVARWDGTGVAPLSSELVAAADGALYDSKRAGRNRVSTSMVMAG
jgi:diguanylate cyclase (GGDEF)-like protein